MQIFFLLPYLISNFFSQLFSFFRLRSTYKHNCKYFFHSDLDNDELQWSKPRVLATILLTKCLSLFKHKYYITTNISLRVIFEHKKEKDSNSKMQWAVSDFSLLFFLPLIHLRNCPFNVIILKLFNNNYILYSHQQSRKRFLLRYSFCYYFHVLNRELPKEGKSTSKNLQHLFQTSAANGIFITRRCSCVMPSSTR